MDQWYFHVRGQAQGPVPLAQLQALLDQGRVRADTPVWRAGMAQWQPLSACLSGTAAPPPLSPVPPPLGAAPPRHVQPTPRGLSGCALSAVIGGVALLLVVPVAAILAAIAIPAYQDYTLRAKVNQALAQAQALKPTIAEHAVSGQCPVNGENGIAPADAYAGPYIASITVGAFNDGPCGLEANLRGISPRHIDGKHLWLSLDAASGNWSCTSDVADKYLPPHCRASAP